MPRTAPEQSTLASDSIPNPEDRAATVPGSAFVIRAGATEPGTPAPSAKELQDANPKLRCKQCKEPWEIIARKDSGATDYYCQRCFTLRALKRGPFTPPINRLVAQ